MLKCPGWLGETRTLTHHYRVFVKVNKEKDSEATTRTNPDHGDHKQDEGSHQEEIAVRR